MIPMGFNQKRLEEREVASAASRSKGIILHNMVSIKKANMGGGSGTATPTQQNGRRAASEVSREKRPCDEKGGYHAGCRCASRTTHRVS